MNYLNFMMLMLMIQLPFTEVQHVDMPIKEVKSYIGPICEWKPEETKNEIVFFKLPLIDSTFKPGDYVRLAPQVNSGIAAFETSIVVSRYGGKVIVNFPVDSEGNVIVNILKKKDGC